MPSPKSERVNLTVALNRSGLGRGAAARRVVDRSVALFSRLMMEPKRSGDIEDAENDDGDGDTLFALAMQQNADAVAD